MPLHIAAVTFYGGILAVHPPASFTFLRCRYARVAKTLKSAQDELEKRCRDCLGMSAEAAAGRLTAIGDALRGLAAGKCPLC